MLEVVSKTIHKKHGSKVLINTKLRKLSSQIVKNLRADSLKFLLRSVHHF